MHSDRPWAAIHPWILCAALSSLLACSPEGEATAETAGAGSATSSGNAPAETTPVSQIPSGRFVGNVVETMDAANYTYVALERGGETVWAAGPQTKVAVGDEIAIGLEMRMDAFHSESLGRTFDPVYFVGELQPTGASVATEGHERPGDPHADVSGAHETPAAGSSDSIDKPAGGYRVVELWDGRDDLAGREVVLRGRVVKYNGGILGRNWLHIQDGSGDASVGNHDVTVTSDQSASVGDVVTVRGVVALDKDFGSGYSYSILVEEANITVD